MFGSKEDAQTGSCDQRSNEVDEFGVLRYHSDHHTQCHHRGGGGPHLALDQEGLRVQQLTYTAERRARRGRSVDLFEGALRQLNGSGFGGVCLDDLLGNGSPKFQVRLAFGTTREMLFETETLGILELVRCVQNDLLFVVHRQISSLRPSTPRKCRRA